MWNVLWTDSLFLKYVESLYTSGLAAVILLTTPLVPIPWSDILWARKLFKPLKKTDSRACSFSSSSGSCCLCLISFTSYGIPFLFMDCISEVSHFMISIPHTRHGVCFHRSESPILMGASLGWIFLPKPPIWSRLALSYLFFLSFGECTSHFGWSSRSYLGSP